MSSFDPPNGVRGKDPYIDVGDSCNALSLSPAQAHLVVGGRHVLKIISIIKRQLDSVVLNLRTGKINMTFSSNDVQWSPSIMNTIATAALNGKVVIWDIGKSGGSKQLRVLSDHTRAVNRISWHPIEPFLLSGSQDGAVKLWDVRSRDACQETIDGHFTAVRDIQWSALNTTLFASGLDSGMIQIWDLRKLSEPACELAGHQGLVLAIDWHSEEQNIIASAGRDRQMKVWDIYSNQSNIPLHTICTNASVARLHWRPGFPSHIASSSTIFDNRVHLWDIHNPFVPIASVSAHSDVITGFQWFETGDALVSCSKDSHVAILSVAESYCPYEHIPLSCIDWSINDNLAIANNGFNRSEACERRFIPKPFRMPDHSNPLQSGSEFKIMPAGLGQEEILTDRSFSGLSKHQFVTLAERYKLTGAPFSDLCIHNAGVARDAGRIEMALVWEMLPVLCSDVLTSDVLPQHRNLSSSLSDVSDMFELVTENEVSTQSLMECIPKIKKRGSTPNIAIREVSIRDLVSLLADNGDVQNCCAIIIVLGNLVLFEPLFVRRCLVSYIEVLHRHQLWTIANEVIRASPDEKVASMNQSDTTICALCSYCNTALEKGRTICTSCLKWVVCSLCRGRVRGRFIPLCGLGCGHGGHPDHIRDWFAENLSCPSGCLHQCRPCPIPPS